MNAWKRLKEPFTLVRPVLIGAFYTKRLDANLAAEEQSTESILDEDRRLVLRRRVAD